MQKQASAQTIIKAVKDQENSAHTPVNVRTLKRGAAMFGLHTVLKSQSSTSLNSRHDVRVVLCADSRGQTKTHTHNRGFAIRQSCSLIHIETLTHSHSFTLILPLFCSLTRLCIFLQPTHIHTYTHTHTHTHTHTCWFLWFAGTFHRCNGFYTVQTVCAIALHLPYT